MRRALLVWALCCLSVCVVCASASADLVVLKDGTMITGKARVTSRAVQIENDEGVLTLPLWRVERVSAGSVHRSVGPAVAPRDAAERAAPRGREAKLVRRVSEPSVSGLLRSVRVLESRISVSFDEMPLADAISYIQEDTGANITYRMSDLEADDMPVTLHLKDVKVRQVLDLLLDGRGLAWSVWEDIIRIRPLSETPQLTMKVYDVRDLLANYQDRLASRTATSGELTTRRDREDGFGQWGRDSDRDYDRDYYRDDDRGYDSRSSQFGRARPATQTPDISARAYNMAVLITETVRPESWATPAVYRVGGAEVSRRDEEDSYQGVGWSR